MFIFIIANIKYFLSQAQTVVEDPFHVNIYLYNAYRNKCLRYTSNPGDALQLTYGACDNSAETVWILPISHRGLYRSKANLDYCFGGECEDDEQFYFYRNDNENLIRSQATLGKQCIGSSETDPSKVVLKDCDDTDPDQIWYFNIWDPSVVVEEPPVVVAPPQTVTVYFYNAYRNGCMHDNLTTGVCDFTDHSLWEIPISHEGYYRSKANPENCLSIVDGNVSLTECNEDTVLYRDGNFIKSPLSEDKCIVSARFSNNLEYIEGCDVREGDHLWYFNIWTPPEPETTSTEVATSTEVVATTEVATSTEATATAEVATSTEVADPNDVFASTEVAVPTEAANSNEIIDLTEVVAPTPVVEEKPIMTITSTVTAVMTEAY
ncbi:hypothetical protein PIROE2DRAFT_60296 [Piromyces sp. E2]|nr:hypothetical protein PIROE2DRAFT_60296 [Piromyces sp. E2]|eukprot:OUM64995.1 hypothetical protein PIROE2DRAFT_60296 [Piromyces sp. E2]